MKVKIYFLRDPITKEIRYLGRTKNRLCVRLAGHVSKARRGKTHKDCWIKSLLKQGLRPVIELVSEVEGWSESYQEEQELIKFYLNAGVKLTNLHDRGEGGLLRVISPEQRRKISEKVKEAHKQGRLHSGRKAVNVYDLEGRFIRSFRSITECADFMEVTNKNLENSLRRKSRRFHQYQVRRPEEGSPGKYINPRQCPIKIPLNGETPEVDNPVLNQQETVVNA